MQKVISILIDPSQSTEKANAEVNKLLEKGYKVVNIVPHLTKSKISQVITLIG